MSEQQNNNGNRNLVDVPEMGEAVEEERVSTRAWVGRFLGPVLAILAYFLLPTGGGENALTQPVWRRSPS